MPGQTGKPPFFNAGYLPIPTNNYVAWVDVMGVRSIMSRSVAITANFVFKLHVTAIEAPQTGIKLYPVMDGLYAVSNSQKPMLAFLDNVLSRLADLFVSTPQMHHRFIVKGALAFGPTIHGCDVLPEAFASVNEGQIHDYNNCVLLGMPMVQAYESEMKAPPFGLYVHESARAFAPPNEEPIRFAWWHWFRYKYHDLAVELDSALDKYFEWCTSVAGAIEYDKAHAEHHKEMARQYFRAFNYPTAAPLLKAIADQH